MKKQTPRTIGILATEANVGVETVRFYERKSLIKQPEKTGSYRHYTDEDVKRIRLIKKAQEIGFTLDEIKDFLVLDSCSQQTKPVIKEKAQLKISEVKQKIEDLKTVLTVLERFMGSCGAQNNSTLACELLECFENDWKCCEKSSE